MLPKEPYKRILVIAAYVLMVGGLAYFVLKYLSGALMPFLIAYAIAVVLHPVVDFITKKTKIPKWLAVVAVVLLAVGIVGVLVYLIINRIYSEVNSLYQTVSNIMSEMQNNPDYADEIIDKINGYIPFFDLTDELRDIWENLYEYIAVFAKDLVTNLDGVVIPVINAVLNTVPPVLIGTIVSIVALYYFVAQYHEINNAVISVLPKRVGEHAVAIKRQFVSAVFMFVRAYGVIMIITFMEVFVGLTVLGVKYAFLIALLTAVVDIMPILGTGAIMIPWGIVEIIMGNYFLGIGILVMYALITVIRQFLEPRIVGKSVGLHPLLALVSMYVGLKFFGVLGLFGFPIGLVIYKRLKKEGFFKFKEVSEEKS